jgi:proton-dependent oligopeptide transporter, POT family
LSFSIANFVAGKIAAITGAESESGEVLTGAEGLANYVGVFSNIGIVLVIIAIAIALLSKPLNKLMHGVV